MAKFYKHHLRGWTVGAQQHLDWPAEIPSDYLPGMKPDLVLQHVDSGIMVVLDTKFTADCLVKPQYGEKLKFQSEHLYQMYAYVMSQRDRSPSHRTATGVLLYPTVAHRVSESVVLQGHRIRWETVDLTRPWEDIENALRAVPGRVVAAKIIPQTRQEPAAISY